jgi:hypothetical protein
MRDDQPAPPPKAHVEPIIYSFIATFSLAVLFGFVFDWVPMWVIGVIGLFISLLIWCFCPPTAYY